MNDIECGGGLFESDPQWMHKCAKDILKKLKINYNIWQVYNIIRILKKYNKEINDN